MGLLWFITCEIFLNIFLSNVAVNLKDEKCEKLLIDLLMRSLENMQISRFFKKYFKFSA